MSVKSTFKATFSGWTLKLTRFQCETTRERERKRNPCWSIYQLSNNSPRRSEMLESKQRMQSIKGLRKGWLLTSMIFLCCEIFVHLRIDDSSIMLKIAKTFEGLKIRTAHLSKVITHLHLQPEKRRWKSCKINRRLTSNDKQLSTMLFAYLLRLVGFIFPLTLRNEFPFLSEDRESVVKFTYFFFCIFT